MRKPTRQEMAAEFRARAKAHREARLKEAAALADIRTGNLESIFGRIVLPGEHPSTAPIGSQENIFGVEESQVLTRPWGTGEATSRAAMAMSLGLMRLAFGLGLLLAALTASSLVAWRFGFDPALGTAARLAPLQSAGGAGLGPELGPRSGVPTPVPLRPDPAPPADDAALRGPLAARALRAHAHARARCGRGPGQACRSPQGRACRPPAARCRHRPRPQRCDPRPGRRACADHGGDPLRQGPRPCRPDPALAPGLGAGLRSQGRARRDRRPAAGPARAPLRHRPHPALVGRVQPAARARRWRAAAWRLPDGGRPPDGGRRQLAREVLGGGGRQSRLRPPGPCPAERTSPRWPTCGGWRPGSRQGTTRQAGTRSWHRCWRACAGSTSASGARS